MERAFGRKNTEVEVQMREMLSGQNESGYNTSWYCSLIIFSFCFNFIP